jgi:predicted amidophosphoribosyltransferase
MPYQVIAPIAIENLEEFDGAWHLVYYIPQRCKSDPYSASVRSFKDGDTKTGELYTKLACAKISQTKIKPDFIIRALSSKEVRATGKKPLDKLGRALAERLGSEYLPLAVLKHRETVPMHDIPHKVDREAELEGVYYLNPEYVFDADSTFLIIDDISTTNTTAHAIKDAILEELPEAQVYMFAIAKTNRNVDSNTIFDPAILA